MLGDARSLLSSSPDPGGFFQPHTGSQIPPKGEKAAEMAAEEKMHLSHGLPPFCMAPGLSDLLVPHCPQSCLRLLES